jgi:hypothetical protein
MTDDFEAMALYASEGVDRITRIVLANALGTSSRKPRVSRRSSSEIVWLVPKGALHRYKILEPFTASKRLRLPQKSTAAIFAGQTGHP